MNNLDKKQASTQGINWVQTGTEHAETVVLIHAVGHDLTYWDRQIEALCSDYNVVAFDLPGHGRSLGEPSDWSLEYGAATVIRLVEQVSTKPVHLVGISFGGMLAQITTLARPDLIRSLTLIGTASSFTDEVRKGMRARAEAVRKGGMAAVVPSSLQRWFTPKTRLERPDIMDRITKTLLADHAETHAAIWDVISGLDIHARLSEISCPTLLLVGEHDPSTPPSVSHGMAQAIQNATVVVISGASHIVTIEAPMATNNALCGFLDGMTRR